MLIFQLFYLFTLYCCMKKIDKCLMIKGKIKREKMRKKMSDYWLKI